MLPIYKVKNAAGTVDAEILLVSQESNQKPSLPKGPYRGHIEKLRKKDAFSGAVKSVQFVRFGGRTGAESVLLVGLGPLKEWNDERFRVAGAVAYSKLSAERVARASLKLDTAAIQPSQVAAFCEGFALASYSFKKHRSKSDKEAKALELTFVIKDKKQVRELESQIKLARNAAECIFFTRDWSNEPSNIGTPEYYAAEAKKLATQYGLKCRILTEKDAEKEKMGLFLSVGRGSARENRLVVLEYTPPAPKNAKTIALVGKGVTFDSGGISIKPSLGMEDMKHDMTGAATMLGATLLASVLKVPNRIVTILAFAENMPSGNATTPGSVITGRSGKTVEIVNTDAEGRLVLADALDYAHEFKPDVIIDAATLTGAVNVALGKQACAVLGTDDALIDSLRRASDLAGERVWQLPLFDEYFEDMKSEYADMRNSANNASGGTIRGAIFLKQFIRKGMAWAHLDIAATAWDMGHLPYCPKKGGSGLFVRTLARFAAEY